MQALTPLNSQERSCRVSFEAILSLPSFCSKLQPCPSTRPSACRTFEHTLASQSLIFHPLYLRSVFTLAHPSGPGPRTLERPGRHCSLPLSSEMLPFASVLITIATLSAAFASRLNSRPYALKERHVVPKHWTRLGRAPADALLDLRIALKQSQFGELERHLNEGNRPTFHIGVGSIIIKMLQLHMK